jgi:hypothetical protein
VAFRVVRIGAGGKYVGAGTSAGTIGLTPGVYSNDARLPIQAGDTIGLDGDFTKLVVVHLPGNTTTILLWTPPLADGGTPRSASTGHSGWELLLNADIATPPVSAPSFIPGCPGMLRVGVTADPDPATGPKAVRYRLDGGGEQVLPAANGTADISLGAGTHTVETWGEDLLGQQEAAHHISTVAVDCPLPTPPAPLLSSAHLSSSTFRAAGQGGSVTRRRRPPIGTTVSYRDSQAATTTFTVLKPVTGHKKGRKCLSGRPRRHQRRCIRYVSVGSFRHGDVAGSVRVRFTGRVRGHKLPPGRYLLTLTPSANGKTGRTVTLSFGIVT